jgi:hydroxyacylglutathione hydrolase
MVLKRIINGKWKENCYILSSEGKSIVIDPGGNAVQMFDYFHNHDLSVSAVINTHAHFDHIGAVSDIIDKFKCPFYLHSKDQKLLRSANLYMSLFEGNEKIKIPNVDFYLDQIESPIILAGMPITILHTPGHTEGSVSLIIGNFLFSGDTLFKGQIGRTDLPGGKKDKLKISLQGYALLEKSLIIYPGHGEPTTLDEELKSNKYLLQVIS